METYKVKFITYVGGNMVQIILSRGGCCLGTRKPQNRNFPRRFSRRNNFDKRFG